MLQTDSTGEMIEKATDLVAKFALPNLPLLGVRSARRKPSAISAAEVEKLKTLGKKTAGKVTSTR